VVLPLRLQVLEAAALRHPSSFKPAHNHCEILFMLTLFSMFCMYKFISAAKAPQVQKQHEQEMRRRDGSHKIGRSGTSSVCVTMSYPCFIGSEVVIQRRYAYTPLQQMDCEEAVVLP
jgi:hypothetical protein